MVVMVKYGIVSRLKK